MDKKTIADELAALRRRVEALESGQTSGLDVSRGERFWLLATLRERLPSPGGVAFGGYAELPDGAEYEWQWGESLGTTQARDWRDAAPRLEALGHPVRLAILQSVLAGHGGTAELAELEELGTRGQLYHHLRSLEAGGWLQSRRRGAYQVPADRVVPLLVILAAVSGR